MGGTSVPKALAFLDPATTSRAPHSSALPTVAGAARHPLPKKQEQVEGSHYIFLIISSDRIMLFTIRFGKNTKLIQAFHPQFVFATFFFKPHIRYLVE